MNKVDFELYLIASKGAAAPRPLIEVAREALEAGVRCIQLRDKELEARTLHDLAAELRELTEGYEARLLINDRVDVAHAVSADGVHLTGKSFFPSEARRLLGASALIGVSTHSVEEARRAESSGADFVTLGPVYRTPSKEPYGEPIGLDPVKEAATALNIPVFAIGGINAKRTEEVIGAGAYGVALISAILSADDVRRAAVEVLKGTRRDCELNGA